MKIIAIGKGQYSADNSDWTDDNTIPVVNDPSPNNTWMDWGANQRDLFFLDNNGNYVKNFNLILPTRERNKTINWQIIGVRELPMTSRLT